jgi:hypothetical protein
VQKQLDIIKESLTKKIYLLFLKKYNGNKSRFAKDVGCNEKTIRLLFDHNQGMSLNLFLKISFALQIQPSELLKDIKLTDNILE